MRRDSCEDIETMAWTVIIAIGICALIPLFLPAPDSGYFSDGCPQWEGDWDGNGVLDPWESCGCTLDLNRDGIPDAWCPEGT